MDLKRPLKLLCTTQNYPWGRRGADSLVAQLAGRTEDRPFAELWAGAHPKSCSLIEFNDGRTVPLQQLIAHFPQQMLGDAVFQTFGAELPFLFKILSVARPLSIQLHPDAGHAPLLHQEDPTNYPDPNHKPEIAVALTEVSLLFGFRPIEAVRASFVQVPELQFLGSEGNDVTLQEIHERILRAPQARLNEASQRLYERLAGKNSLSAEDDWVMRVRPDFPEGDVGLFYFYLLNLVTLRPGEAVFIRPNVPHAYLSGDLAECLANSDNVIRGGLTGKYKDIETLLKLADFTAQDSGRLEPTVVPPAGQIFRPPVREFALEVQDGPAARRTIPGGKFNLLFSLSARGSISGRGFDMPLGPGDVFVLPASIEGAQLIISAGKLFRVTVP